MSSQRIETARSTDIVVLGSVNQDRFSYVAELPERGETVITSRMLFGLGGKGANQAIAAARVGSSVIFAGLIGRDSAGWMARADLEESGVDCCALGTHDSASTGTALITVDATGENTIVVDSGANREVSVEYLDHALQPVIESIRPAVVLTQGELPVKTIDAAALLANRGGARFVLNLAPIAHVAEETLGSSDPLILNEGEARDLAKRLGLSWEDRPVQEIASSLATVARSVVITIGAGGAVAADAGQNWRQVGPRPTRVTDTTGAGDAFVGVLTSAIARGETLRMAVKKGVLAGTFAVQSDGTTPSYIDEESLDCMLLMFDSDGCSPETLPLQAPTKNAPLTQER